LEYKNVKEARPMRGIRLALSKGAPGIWGQAARKMLEYKELPYVPVAQYVGEPNEELVAWTGLRNAPVLVHNDEPPISRWQDLVVFVDKLKPAPPIQAQDSRARVLLYGIINELAGEWGYGWCGRLMIFQALKRMKSAAGEAVPESTKMLLAQYGYSDEAAAIAPERCATILRMLSAQLHDQRNAGSDFLVGSEVTAADIYWACFSNLLEPWPEWACDVAPELRPSRRPTHPSILAARDPILIEHRDNMFRKYLRPITF